MTGIQVKDVAVKYIEFLKKFDCGDDVLVPNFEIVENPGVNLAEIKACRNIAADFDTLIRIRHLITMCEKIPTIVDEGRLEKAHRWLGFVQGCLWVFGLKLIDEMKEDNR